MKIVANIAIVVAVIALIAGLISRITMTPVTLGCGGQLQARAFLAFANTNLLIAITFILLQILKAKK